jgi:hypothetical protein
MRIPKIRIRQWRVNTCPEVHHERHLGTLQSTLKVASKLWSLGKTKALTNLIMANSHPIKYVVHFGGRFWHNFYQAMVAVKCLHVQNKRLLAIMHPIL